MMICRDEGSEDRCENLKIRREEECYVTAKCAMLLRSVLCYCEVCLLLQSALCYCEVCYVTATRAVAVKCVMLL